MDTGEVGCARSPDTSTITRSTSWIPCGKILLAHGYCMTIPVTIAEIQASVNIYQGRISKRTRGEWKIVGYLLFTPVELGDLKSSTAPPVLLAYVDNNNIPLGIPCWRKTPETAKTTPIPPNSNRSDNNLIDLIEHLFDGMYDYMVAHGPGCRTNIKCKTNNFDIHSLPPHTNYRCTLRTSSSLS